jgi:acetyl esterase/lipase
LLAIDPTSDSFSAEDEDMVVVRSVVAIVVWDGRMSLMSYSLFFGLTVAATISAGAAVVCVPTPSYRGFAGFFLGFPAFHFTGVMLLVGASITAIAVWLGALSSVLGEIGIGTAVVGFAALLTVRSRSLKAGVTMQRALEESLGADFREWIPPAVDTAPFSRLWSNPWRLRLRDVERIADLSYGEAGERNQIDLYRLRTQVSKTARPILLWIHGGAWTVGHKRQQGLPLLYGMASRGWVTAAINYRLGPTSRFPDPLVDVKRAIAWLRTNAAQYGADPQFIIACGGSAGGHLAALAALTANHSGYQPGFETVDTRLAAVIPLYGRFDFVDRSGVLPDKRPLISFLANKVMPRRYEEDPQLWDQASPIARVGSHAPPMFVLHGTHDSVIPIAEAAAFVDASQRVSAQPVAFARVHGAQHGWDLFNTPWTGHTVNALHSFCEYTYAKYIERSIRES